MLQKITSKTCGYFNSCRKMLKKRGRDFVTAVIGQGLYQAFSLAFDFIYLPALIVWFGIITGGAIYMISSLLVDLISVLLYDQVKQDILGLELAKELRGWLGTRLLKTRKKITELSLFSKTLLVLGLSWRLNPFEVVIFMRQAHEYRKKMNVNDHFIFWTSYVFGNLYWILIVGGVVEIVKFFA